MASYKKLIIILLLFTPVLVWAKNSDSTDISEYTNEIAGLQSDSGAVGAFTAVLGADSPVLGAFKLSLKEEELLGRLRTGEAAGVLAEGFNTIGVNALEELAAYWSLPKGENAFNSCIQLGKSMVESAADAQFTGLINSGYAMHKKGYGIERWWESAGSDPKIREISKSPDFWRNMFAALSGLEDTDKIRILEDGKRIKRKAVRRYLVKKYPGMPSYEFAQLVADNAPVKEIRAEVKRNLAYFRSAEGKEEGGSINGKQGPAAAGSGKD
jgi:hypothetical protein